MYFLISAALLVNAAFAANLHPFYSTGNLGLSSLGYGSAHGLSGLSSLGYGSAHGLSGLSEISGLSGYTGLSGVSGISGLSGSYVSSAAPVVSEVVVGGAANPGLLAGGAHGISSGEVVVGGAAPALSGAAVVGEQVISGGALSTGFTPLGVTTYTAQAPAVKKIYRDSSHVHPAKEVVYKIKTPPKVHQKVIKYQEVVKQPKINVLEVVQSPKIQKLSILEKPAKQIVDVLPTKHTSSQVVVKAPEAPLTQKVFYSEKAREASGNIVSYEKHNIRPAQVSTLSAGAPGGVYVSHSGPSLAGGPTYTTGVVGGQTFETLGGDHTTLGLGGVGGQTLGLGAVSGQTLGLGAVGGQTLGLGGVGGQTLGLGGVGGQTLGLGAVSGQTFGLGAVGGQTFETTLGADNLGAIGGQGIELGTGGLNVHGADGETALNLGSAVGGGNVKTWVENSADGFTHHKVVKGGDLATWNAEFGSSTFGAGHDLNPAVKK